MYPELITRTDCDDREHPEFISMELFQGKYRVYDSFWDGTKYQSQTVGARYGYRLLSAARKAYDLRVAQCKGNYENIQAHKRENEQRWHTMTPPAKPRLSIPAIARQIA